jgi:hypothetical protein
MQSKLLSNDERKKLRKKHPLNSIGKAEEIANAAYFLLHENQLGNGTNTG